MDIAGPPFSYIHTEQFIIIDSLTAVILFMTDYVQWSNRLIPSN